MRNGAPILHCTMVNIPGSVTSSIRMSRRPRCGVWAEHFVGPASRTWARTPRARSTPITSGVALGTTLA